MNYSKITLISIVVSWLMTLNVSAQPAISNVTVSDVTPHSFSVIWVAGEPSVGQLEVYTDPDGINHATAIMSNESEKYLPAQDLGVHKIQVAELFADAEYYFRIITTSKGAGGSRVYPETLPLLSVVTEKQITRTVPGETYHYPFANDQLVINAYKENGLTPAVGSLVLLKVEGADYPVSTFVGGGTIPPGAIIDLNNLFDKTSNSNLNLVGGEKATLSLVGGLLGKISYSITINPDSENCQIVWADPPSVTLGLDTDVDGILDDGDYSGTFGDHSCMGGNSTNCDDNCFDIQNPGQADTDGDGVGDACDACTDADGDGYCANVNDCADNNADINPGASDDNCNGIDENCNGVVDDSYVPSLMNCGTGACSSILYTVCQNGSVVGTCIPGTPQPEVCDDRDNDCDGSTDEGVMNTYYRDLDKDSYGNLSVAAQACYAPTGYVSNYSDCNDNNATINPGVAERCDRLDNNCNEQTDENACPIFYFDPVALCGGNTPCYASVQAGIDAVGEGAVIKLTQGTYHENILVNSSKNIIMEGGWDSNFFSRNGTPGQTILDGDISGDGIGDGNVLSIYAGPGVKDHIAIEGITIRNGKSDYGGGIYASSAGLESSITLTLTNNIIAGSSGNYGVGIYIGAEDSGNAALVLNSNTITDNAADNSGGGIMAASFSAGMIAMTLENNIVWGNTAPEGDDISIYNAGGMCTVNVFHNNIASVYIDQLHPGSYNDLGGNINANPVFENPEAKDYHLASDSPCIDKGTNEGAPSIDYEGDQRPMDGDGDSIAAADMGADEYFDPRPRYILKVSKSGKGSGTVTSGIDGINCGLDCTEAYINSSRVTLTATPGPHSSFTNWTGCASVSGSTCNVKMNAAKTVIATFTRDPKYTVTVTKAGTGKGVVTSNSGGITCPGDCSEAYWKNDIVVLTSAPAAGSIFKGWSGACTGLQSICTLTMTAAKSVKATFIPNPVLTAVKTGTGTGSIASNDGGITCGNIDSSDCTETYAKVKTITLIATPGPHSSFTNWTGCASVSGSTCNVNMNAAKTVTATFTRDPKYTVTVTKAGTGKGVVTSNSVGITCPGDCSEAYWKNDIVVLTSAPAAGSTFKGWSGACTGLQSICTLTMTAAKSVTATFTR